MDNSRGRRSQPRAPRAPVIALVWILLACSSPVELQAQLLKPDESATGYGQRFHDYFTRYTDPSTTALLRTVEQYHLSGSFWRFYRHGEFNSAGADLQYVLNMFPNHPTALHLIAYDQHLKLEPSAVIQQFELAIQYFPEHAYTYAQYGRYLMSIGRRKAGIELLDKALRLDPSLTVARAWSAEGGDSEPSSEAAPSGDVPAKILPPRSPGNAPRPKR